ncbi:potassium voltage-gated channel protein Shaw-like [Ruditapes philippinarum]|uniref:potassium voltage-gated channel protein Shaw-like n=1 Tax=Ruditapes philippinarum TaxID=129788 RepID=UPI00295C029E|nr:potassium voltage-gated channel protein Shaw-like [Ruditapes philippinarum]
MSMENSMSSAIESNRLLEGNDSGNETLTFNIGGVIFETYRSTIMRIKSGPLTDESFLEANHRPGKNDYFFDRDPDAFKIVLNFLRTGKVFIPSHIDGPLVRNELMFWGLTPDLEVMISGDISLGAVIQVFQHSGVFEMEIEKMVDFISVYKTNTCQASFYKWTFSRCD